MRTVYIGTSRFALEVLEASGLEPALVITRPPARRGRGRHVEPSPVASAARAAGLAVREPERLEEVTAEIDALAPDLLCLCAYGALVRAQAEQIRGEGVELRRHLLEALGLADLQAGGARCGRDRGGLEVAAAPAWGGRSRDHEFGLEPGRLEHLEREARGTDVDGPHCAWRSRQARIASRRCARLARSSISTPSR